MLKEKIKSKESSIVLYSLTPPKRHYSTEKVDAIASQHIVRIQDLSIDGLVLYDVQDESSRNKSDRPFPFSENIDPTDYAKQYFDSLPFPVIVYKAVSKCNHNDMNKWIQQSKDGYTVFVGASSSKDQLGLTLTESYNMYQASERSITLGGVVIPERHMKYRNEHVKVFEKIESGCQFFISQAVYNVEVSKQFLTDYANYAKKNQCELVPIIFTLAPCGSVKTLEFMKWLGVDIPASIEDLLRNSDEILTDSVDLSLVIFQILYNYGKSLGIPIGCNIESLSHTQREIEASLFLLEQIQRIISKGHP